MLYMAVRDCVLCDFAPMEKFLNENWQLIIVNNVPPLRLPTTNGCQTQISWERNYVSMVITKISFYCKKDTNSHSATLQIETGSFLSVYTNFFGDLSISFEDVEF